MPQWSLTDIPWHHFDASKAEPELVSLAKSACMVEHNGYDYARYLRDVFADDSEIHTAIENWALEEVQHGKALRKWAEMADPQFNFEESFHTFTQGYHLPLQANASVRGSRYGELIARCVVESGTSNYYTAIKEYTDEPVLKAICAKIAADEYRHYKLFYGLTRQYAAKDRIGTWKRLRIALGRVAESEDDELAYAYFAAHNAPAPYNRKLHARLYLACLGKLFRKKHVDNMTAMIFKAVNIKPHHIILRLSSGVAWNLMQFRMRGHG